jgi:hypothetical protein
MYLEENLSWVSPATCLTRTHDRTKRLPLVIAECAHAHMPSSHSRARGKDAALETERERERKWVSLTWRCTKREARPWRGPGCTR